MSAERKVARTGEWENLRKQGRRAQKRQDIVLRREFVPKFWEDSDNRLGVVRIIRKRYELLKEHAGGGESCQRDLLCQRAAFLSTILETKEVEAAEGQGLDTGGYIQALNGLNGLLKSLGLAKRIKNVTDLATYLNERAAQ